MKISLSCDDACTSDVRVAELAKKYNIECTFYWPVEWHSLAYDNGYDPLSWGQAQDIARDFEIGSHTITHRHLTAISHEEAVREIYDSKEMLEDLLGVDITKFAPPRGYTNKELTAFTLGHYSEQRLTKGPGLVHVHPSSGANGNLDWRDYYRMVRERGENDGSIELWGHSHEFDRFNLWEQLEKVLKEG